ncbi:Protein detoxification 16 [Vitis vinifera]|uniref:Protein detoxification 16 n=1 Tax=Vitis vinifera TaxID=29760 RepID=A0A438D2W8_VITVI|nr:Protein detoxification 16 [Vitis vinifera]
MVRGSGKQKIDALINLGAYYLVGIPSGALLAFVYHIGGNVTLILPSAKKATNRVHHDSIVPVNVASSMAITETSPISMDGEDQKPSLESPLISQEAVSHSKNGAKREEILGEVKKQLKIAGPLMLVNVLLYSLQVISVMFVGHLGELALSGASMATSFASVTGFSLICPLNLRDSRLLVLDPLLTPLQWTKQ